MAAPHLEQWRRLVEQGAAATVAASLAQIEALRAGDVSHLTSAAVHRIAKPVEPSLGMCGFLHAYDPIRRKASGEAGSVD